MAVDEETKHAILIAASILAVRRLAQIGETKPSPALNAAIHDAVVLAERILQKVDALFPQKRPV
jgi:hypothetical protein